MPELPEVETVRRLIAPQSVGHTIKDVVLRDFAAVLEGPDGVDPRGTLIGATITGVERRGKYLLVSLDSGLWVVVHLRMTGRLLLRPTGSPPVRFEHIAIMLDDGYDLRFGDQRKFGRVRVSLPNEVAALSRRLGPEPFDRRLTGRALHVALARRPGKIKQVLLDQALLAGLGNIYVDEALHRARIHPEQPARTLTLGDATRLLGAIRHVLRVGLQNKGTTFSTFENPYGEAGSNAAALQVYGKGRSGAPCPRCGTPLKRLTVGGRGTSFCPRCQVVAPAGMADGRAI
jgi:formamidopyrimidine-DNA glycosylase